MATKDLFIKGISDRETWQWQEGQHYIVQKGYQWFLGEMEYKDWSRIIWARAVSPRHATTTWFSIHQKLPFRCRIARFSAQHVGLECTLCEEAEEDMDHLFFSCRWAKDYWQAIKQWWPTTIVTSSTSSFIHSILNLKGPKRQKTIAYAIYAAGIYQIWRARNEKIFAQHQLSVQLQFKHTRNHIKQSILTLNSITRKYDKV